MIFIIFRLSRETSVIIKTSPFCSFLSSIPNSLSLSFFVPLTVSTPHGNFQFLPMAEINYLAFLIQNGLLICAHPQISSNYRSSVLQFLFLFFGHSCLDQYEILLMLFFSFSSQIYESWPVMRNFCEK